MQDIRALDHAREIVQLKKELAKMQKLLRCANGAVEEERLRAATAANDALSLDRANAKVVDELECSWKATEEANTRALAAEAKVCTHVDTHTYAHVCRHACTRLYTHGYGMCITGSGRRHRGASI